LGRKVHDYLALAFTDPGTAKYALTTAIAEVHLRGDYFAGILYPSVAKSGNADNLALLPAFAAAALRLASAQVVRTESIGGGGVEGTYLCDLQSVEPDGTLIWTWREPGVGLAPGETRAVKPGDVIGPVQSSGDIEIGGQAYHIEPGYTIEITYEPGAVVRNARGEVVPPK
jgi:hypothetical protein